MCFSRYFFPALITSACWISHVRAAEVGTAFTYQGVLENPPGHVVNDTCAFEFALCDDAVAACSPGTISSHATIDVLYGVFTVPDLDFGDDGCNGEARWMEISVKCSGDASFVTLSPRVELKPAPYSIRAGTGVGGPNALNVTPDGKIGIGNNAPQAQLDVNGAVRATTIEIIGGMPYSGAIAGWGLNNAGQTDVPVGMVENYIDIAGGVDHSLAMREDGTLVGWGSNSNGQINVPSGSFTVVAASGDISVAIRPDGRIFGWGGPMGTWNTSTEEGFFVDVAPANTYVIALRDDHTIASWGSNTYVPGGAVNPPDGSFVRIASGTYHSLAVRDDGTLVGFGRNSSGQLNVPSGTFLDVAAGDCHSVGIRTDGTLIAWGCNNYGQLDVPSGTYIAVVAGYYHGVAMRPDGSLIAWGNNGNGQWNVPSGTFSKVAGTGYHNLALRTSAVPEPALRLLADSAFKPGSNTWTIYSDRRLKKEIAPLSGALERLLQLHGVTFNWRDPASQGGIKGRQMGLIADEVQKVFPQWVGRDAKGYQTLTVGGFEALTVEAFRELQEQNDRRMSEKDREIEQLKSELAKLQESVKALGETQN